MLLDIVLIKQEAAVVVAMGGQGKLYHLRRQEDDQMGPPHIYIFAGLLSGPLGVPEQIGAKHKEEIQTS